MPNDKATQPGETPQGWRVMKSDAGRFWATRERPFTTPEMQAGAKRTVDGDDEAELAAAIGDQEALADGVSR